MKRPALVWRLVRVDGGTSLSRVATFVFASSLIFASVLFDGCAARGSGSSAIPLPRAPISAVSLGGNRIAVLAGNAREKAMYIVDMTDSSVITSFGVGKEATDVTTVSAEGPLLVSIAAKRPRPTGTIERWTIDGTRTGTLALPGPAVRITRMVDGEAYALVARGSVRSAVPVLAWPLRALPPLPLEANIRSLQQCRFGGRQSYLVYATADGHIAARDVASHALLRSKVRGEAPTCIDDGPTVYAIVRRLGTATIVALAFPSFEQTAALPASTTVVALLDATDDHRLAALDSTPQVGALDLFAAVQPR